MGSEGSATPRRGRKQPGGCAWRLCRALTVLATVGLLTVWVAEATFAERHLTTLLITYLPQAVWVAPVGLLTLLCLLLRQGRLFWFNLMLTLVAAVVLLRPSWPREGPTYQRAKRIRVVTWNVRGGPLRVVRLTSVLERLQPDIVCFQEAQRGSLQEALPGAEVAATHEVITFCRGQIVSSRPIRLGPYPNFRYGLETDLVLPQGHLKVLNVHWQVYQLLTWMMGLERGEEEINLRRSLGWTRQARENECRVVLDWLAATPGPKLVVGDFNTPPNALLYRRMAERAVDSFTMGSGFGFTYRRNLPVVRIDYVWCADGLQPVSCFVVDGRKSDHRLVVADVILER